MTLEQLKGRRQELQLSLQNLQQSFHIVTGHLQEVDYQIKQMEEDLAKSLENPVETPVE